MTTQTNLPVRRFNVDEYYKMAEIGILPWGGGYELIDGVVCLHGHGTPRRFTVDEYYKMAEAGILTHDERVELINGEIVEMSPIGSRHASSVSALDHLMAAQLGRRALVIVQNPLHLASRAEPQPDVMVVGWRDDFYAERHPEPDDLFLLIEVSDSTLDYDRDEKLTMYAGADIPESWIINIPDRMIEVYTDPSAGEYRTRRTFSADETVSPTAFPDVTLPVSRIVPA